MIFFFCGDARGGRVSAKIFKTKRLEILTSVAQGFFKDAAEGRSESAQIGRFEIALMIFDGLK